MKVLAVCALPLLSLGIVAFAKRGPSWLAKPYVFSTTYPSAKDYWVEFVSEDEAWVRTGWRGRWPIDGDYHGESCELRVLEPRGLKHRFLLFDCAAGAWSMRRILWSIEPDGSLVRIADFGTVNEIYRKADEEAEKALFVDVDGDGIPELTQAHRRWIFSDQGELVDHWGIEMTYHAWDGTRFVPQFRRVRIKDVDGPLEILEGNRSGNQEE